MGHISKRYRFGAISLGYLIYRLYSQCKQTFHTKINHLSHLYYYFFTESERHISKLLQNQVCLYLLDLHIHFLGVAEHIKTHAYISQY